MSQAQELLNSLVDQPATSVANTNAEEHIIIGRDRVIVIPTSLKRLGVQYDHNIETVTFDCPRFWDEHDLSQMKIYINYMLPNNTVGGDVAKNITIVGDNISFDWTITNNVTQYKGNLAILVCAKKTDENGNEINHWNSELNREAYISEGMDCGDVVLMEYPDIITALLTRMDAIEKNTPQASPGQSGIYVGPEEPTDPNVEVWIDPDDEEVQTFIEVPTTAKVGQTIVVKSVDENGKPTEWEAADMVSGGSGGGENWRLLNSVVTEEDVNVLSITTDSDGKPFVLKKVKVFARIRGNTSGATSWIRLTVNNLRHAFYTAITNSFAVTDGQDYFLQNRVDISIHDGYAWCDLIMRSNNNAASRNSLQFFQLMGQEGGLDIGIEKIESIDIYASGAGVGAGSEIVIWGVDAE